MTHSIAPVLRFANWLLPWIVIVFASAVLAYATSGALAGQTVLAQPTPAVTATSCPPIGNGYGSYVDSSVVAESRRIACGHGAP